MSELASSAGDPGDRTAAASTQFAHLRVEDFLTALAARRPAPGGGAVAAVTVAAAAALVAMAARFSAELPDAEAVAAEADSVRTGVTGLADTDAAAYGAVLAAFRTPHDEGRRDRIRDALRGAAEVPLRIAEAGARVAGLGARVGALGNPNLIGDAHTGVLVAEAATRAAANLVAINVELGGLDPGLRVVAEAHAGVAAAARDAIVGVRA